MREQSKVFKMIALISQIGITMLSSVFLCGGIGYLIDEHFETHTFLIALLLGIAGGYRAVYDQIKQYLKQEKNPEEELLTKMRTDEEKWSASSISGVVNTEEEPDEDEDSE